MAPDHSPPRRTSGTPIRRPPLAPRGPRLPPLITCSTSIINETTFSGAASTVTFTPSATQDTPALGGVVERLERILEEGEKNSLNHETSGSMTLRAECLAIRSRTIEGDEHCSGSLEEGPGPSAAAPRETASCPPQVGMLRHGQERGCSTLATRRNGKNEEFEHVLSLVSEEEEEEDEIVWDVARDNETLEYFYHNPKNLVLDSVFPECTPHIVITPVEETWEDQHTSWLNRVDIQWPCYLVVPPVDMSMGQLPVCEPISQVLPGLPACPPPFGSNAPLTRSCGPMPVFCPSRFRQYIASAAVERLVLTQVVKILQKAQCKAAFFDASSLARSFRTRYDALPSILSSIEPAFTWRDPAEPILDASRRLFGTTIIDSPCPFRIPHIVINAPPPQPPQLTEDNATPYIQDAGFGQRLTVPSCSVEIINAAEDADWVPGFSFADDSDDETSSSADLAAVDPFESEHSSRPGTPAPGTPVEEDDDDHHFFYVRHGEEDYDDMGVSPVYSSVQEYASQVEPETTVAKLQATSRRIFFIDEDEDDLPSLDDW
ncbi:hypothetical protein LshimejAT787_0109320 [Lyophyllum shimeji]|uniref:Uncharacterized protein n=1 Tax=Lyophyllum shimeji TaxID=47721 RepID=A0A9P3PDU9_LYOSH|nr:hypothetical protein LshimejAT787_0109320 [Lyophyllum shimeji]